ncbi:MAG: glycogen/starch synthase, ADP-glucose type, partial [Candidatus Binatus sp.]|nr:glycogen/starch synthase, ADP-glucose type [Candidatus Binatus sp.]
MKIAIVAAEIAPHAKAGGLAVVIGALPGAVKEIGEQPSLIVPGYKSILEKIRTTTVESGLKIEIGSEIEPFKVLRAHDPHGVPMYLIDHRGFFGRDGIYGEHGGDYPDNMRRFIFFSRAAAIVAADTVQPDVVHAHDWHAAATTIAMRADAALTSRFEDTLAILTIHNLAFQGLGAREDFALLNIDKKF